MGQLKNAILGPMRIPFLILTPACILLGLATAVRTDNEINLGYLLLALAGGLAAHISVNALNEYHDFKSGLDYETQPTPFSGGSGTLPQMPEKAVVALITGLSSLMVTILIGAYFVYVRGWWLLPLGILGILDILAYTQLLTRNPYLCLIAPGIGFGPLMVMGTAFVLTGAYSWAAFWAALVPFFLVSNLLLLNQFPDVNPDKGIGRRHVLIAFGPRAGAWIFGLFLLGAYLTIISGYFLKLFPVYGLIGLASAVIAIPTVRAAAQYAHDIPKLIPYMAKNVIVTLVTPVLLAIGLFIGR